MTIHFAAARSTARSPIARALARRALGRAANDNGAFKATADNDPSCDALFYAALRHFAAHGLGAARAARAEAERALDRDDRQGFDWWLGICRALDRRLAAEVARRNAPLLRDAIPPVSA